MRAHRLAGWPRLCIVLSVLYALPVSWLFSSDWPDASSAKTEWAENSVALLAKYAGVSPGVVRYELFGPATDDQVVSRIYRLASPGADAANSAGTMRDTQSLAQLQESCLGEYKREVAARDAEKKAARQAERDLGSPRDELGGAQPEGKPQPYTGTGGQKTMEDLLDAADKLFAKEREAEAREGCRVKALKTVLQRGGFAEVKDFNLPAFKLELTNLERAYYEQLHAVSQRKRDKVLMGFLVWLVPVIAVYLLGLAIGWVYRGFKEPRG